MTRDDQSGDSARGELGAQIRRLNAEKRSPKAANGNASSDEASMADGPETRTTQASATHRKNPKSSHPAISTRLRAWWGGYDPDDYDAWLKSKSGSK